MEGVQKQLRRACGGSPRETCLGHTGRGMDPGRDRVGQTNKLTYRLARKGSRPPASDDQRTQSTYLFGAVCPQNAEPVSPSRCLQLHLDEIATKVTPRRPRHSHPRSSLLTWRKKTCTSQAASRSCRCRRVTPRAQQPGKHPAVHASEPAVEPHLQIFQRHRRSLLLRLEHPDRSVLENQSIAHRDSAVVGHSL